MRIGLCVLLLICWVGVLSVWAEPEEISKKGCRDCHRFSLNEKQPNKGPDLFYAGDKFHQNWLQKFLQSPTVIREVVYSSGSVFLTGKPEANQPHVALAKEESERVSSFLMTLRLLNFEAGKIDEKPLSKGDRTETKILFERNLGCISCHKALSLTGKIRGGVSGPSLVNSGIRLKPDWVFHWLTTPQNFIFKGRMPVFNLDEEITIRITKYILSMRTSP